MSLNRRTFVKVVGAGAVAASSATPSIASTRSANEKLRVAAIGFHGRGKDLIGAIKKSPDAKLVALCDADEQVLNGMEKDNNKLDRTTDFRELLDRKDIDAIISATPNHWHALLSILAVQSGKHVYIEKPISHNMHESAMIAKASDKYGKMVQCGFQNRSDTGLLKFYKKLHAGDYGKVLMVHGACHRKRKSIGKRDTPLEIPKNINYDRWLGPAEDQPVMRPRLHYDWHWDFNTGNGDCGNQGPHEWDLLNWALGDPENLPSKMIAAGNRFGWNDAADTPNVMGCIGESNGIPVFFEVMDLVVPNAKAPYDRGVGVIIETEKGRFVGGRGGGRYYFHDGKSDDFTQSNHKTRTNEHVQNFLDAILKNDRSFLRADCSVAGRSSSMAHMANISYQMGSEGAGKDIEAVFLASETGRSMLGRLRESTKAYAQKNGIKVEPWLLGVPLEFDNSSQKFVGDNHELANQKMTRDYRAGYELPEIS